MGKIWLETSDNKLIHLPVVGADVNTPDDALRVPTSLVMSIDRCWSNQIVAVHPTYGTITLDLMPDGMTGSCNQCGQCCGHPVADCQDPPDCGYITNTDLNWHVCQYLTIDKFQKWGDPNNSECSLYATILDNFKGCAYPVKTIHPWMTSCGFSVI